MPAKKQRKKEEINLLPEKGFESTTTGRILAWILTTFRVIVIVTEIIVMIAFLSRFWLDAQNSDLNEQIQQKQAVLSASLNFERQFKLTQKRLNIFNILTSSKEDYPAYMKSVSESVPSDVILTEIILTPKTIELSGFTPNEKSIQQLSANLNSRNNFSGFSVSKINSNLENSSLLDFKIKGKLKIKV